MTHNAAVKSMNDLVRRHLREGILCEAPSQDEIEQNKAITQLANVMLYLLATAPRGGEDVEV